MASLLADPGIVRNRLKVSSTIENARRAFLTFMGLLAAVFALIVVSAVGFVLFDRMRERSAAANPPPSAPGTVALPVVAGRAGRDHESPPGTLGERRVLPLAPPGAVRHRRGHHRPGGAGRRGRGAPG